MYWRRMKAPIPNKLQERSGEDQDNAQEDAKGQNCCYKQLQERDFSSWRAKSEVWKTHVVCFSSSVEVRGWICHPPPLLGFGVFCGLPREYTCPHMEQ